MNDRASATQGSGGKVWQMRGAVPAKCRRQKSRAGATVREAGGRRTRKGLGSTEEV